MKSKLDENLPSRAARPVPIRALSFSDPGVLTPILKSGSDID
jgi:hypothetical protein